MSQTLSRRALLALGLAATAARAQSPGALRLALVVGNAAYAAAPLQNPVNDARAMATSLRSMGFEVIEARDATQAEMQRAVQQAGERLRGQQGIGLFYFAGHGVQFEVRNYLMPVDAQPRSASELRAQSFDLQQVIDAFKAAGTQMNIVVLDACRDNPFGKTAGTTGLAPLDAPPGTFLAYATAPGFVAEDGQEGGNGLYTGFLLKELQQRGARIEDVFKRVRLQVRRASQGRQVPWESTSLEDDFVFATGARAQAPSDSERDASFDAEKRDWDRIKASTRSEDLYDFLQRWPNGRIAEIAQFRLDQLARPALLPSSGEGRAALPSGSNRYALGDTWVIERQDALAGTTRRIRFEVTAIEGQRVIVDNGAQVLDQMGGVLRNRFGSKDPALMLVPADLQLGKRWRSAFSNDNGQAEPSRSYYDSRVVAFEAVEVPAGRFMAFRIEHRGASHGSSGGRRELSVTSWVDPRTMMTVRHEVLQKALRGGRVLEQSSDRLVSLQRAPRG